MTAESLCNDASPSTQHQNANSNITNDAVSLQAIVEFT